MSLLLRVIVVITVMSTIPLVAGAQQVAATQRAREIVALQATLELNAWKVQAGDEVSPMEIEISRVDPLDSLTTLWRARVLSMSHWPGYSVAIRGTRILRLGGFLSSDLAELSQLILSSRATRDDLIRHSATLAVARGSWQ